MRIAIDLSGVRTPGTRVYSSNFMSALAKLNSDDEFMIFLSPEVDELIKNYLPSNFVRHITNVTGRVELRVLWEQTVLPMHLQKWSADVLFSPFDIAPLLSPCPVLLAIRNPTPLLLANPRLDKLETVLSRDKLHMFLAQRSCHKAKLVFYPSIYASKLLGDVMKVPADKRAVIYHGTDYTYWSHRQESTSVLNGYNLTSNRYMLFISQFYPYKQPHVLVKAYTQWRNTTGQTDYKLVLVGGAPNIAYEQELRQVIRDSNVKDDIILTGHVPRSHIPILYQHASVFVLPTVMETFGQPFIEAMASGVPVIAADTEFAHELCNDAALYFPPSDAQSLADVIHRVISQPSLSNKMKECGYNRARMFSWDREAEETLALLKRVGSAN